MTNSFREIVRAHFISHGIDDPVGYLAKRGGVFLRTVNGYLRAGNLPIGQDGGLNPQQAGWLIEESRAVIRNDSAGYPNQVEKILKEKLDVYHAGRARRRKAANPPDRRKAKRPRTGKSG